MKTLYISKGQALNYDTLEAEHPVVNGVLNVAHGLKARSISGDGLILVGTGVGRREYCAHGDCGRARRSLRRATTR